MLTASCVAQRPADLPVQMPTKYRNRSSTSKRRRRLGLTRSAGACSIAADEVIE